MSAIYPSSDAFLRELSEKEFRVAYMADQVRTGIAYQLKAMREQPERDWTQDQLGDRMKKPQSTVARLENPDYGRVTLTTLLEAAKAMDVALLVQFVEWDDFLERMADVSPSALRKKSFDLQVLKGQRPEPKSPTPDLYVTQTKASGDFFPTPFKTKRPRIAAVLVESQGQRHTPVNPLQPGQQQEQYRQAQAQ